VHTKFSQTGGARIGRSFWLSMNVTWPFASLTVTSEWIEVTVLWIRRYHFSRSAIRRIERFHGVFSRGIRIVHSEELYPDFVVFWTFDFARLQLNLEAMGYFGP
jgi:hypothetical protein